VGKAKVSDASIERTIADWGEIVYKMNEIRETSEGDPILEEYELKRELMEDWFLEQGITILSFE